MRCLKCGGNLFKDEDGTTCLQCGKVVLNNPPPINDVNAKKQKVHHHKETPLEDCEPRVTREQFFADPKCVSIPKARIDNDLTESLAKLLTDELEALSKLLQDRSNEPIFTLCDFQDQFGKLLHSLAIKIIRNCALDKAP